MGQKESGGNDIRKTNIPGIRIDYRERNLQHEWKYITSVINDNTPNRDRSNTPTFSKLSRW